ncbi:unnamed protein product [Urochloa humidicola]
MEQGQEILRLEKLLDDKDAQINYLVPFEEKSQLLKDQMDELINKNVDLKIQYIELKCAYEELMDTHAKLEVAHEVVITMIKSSQPTNHTCSQEEKKEKQSWFEQMIIEDCNDDLVNENEVLKQEVDRLLKDLTKLKGNDIARPSQDNREFMVKKLEKGSTVQSYCNPASKSNKSKPQANKKNLDHIKCFKCSKMGHYASLCSSKLEGQQTLSKRQRSLSKRRCFGCCKRGHKIASCPRRSRKLLVLGSAELINPAVPSTKGQLNKGFKKAQEQYMERNVSEKNKSKTESNLKHKVCYTCRGKGHLGKDCPDGNTPKPIHVNNANDKLKGSSSSSNVSRMIKSSTTSIRAIWVPKSLLTNSQGPNGVWVPRCA